MPKALHMSRHFLNIFRSLVSNQALTKIYERRRSRAPDQNNRTLGNVLIVLAVLFGLMTFVSSMVIVDRDANSYLKTRNRVSIFDENENQWKFGIKNSCSDPVDCASFNLSDIVTMEPKNLERIGALAEYNKDRRLLRIQTEIKTHEWQSLSEFLTLVISLPNFKYNKADVYLNGLRQRSFFLSRAISFPFETSAYRGQTLTVDLLLEALPGESFAAGKSTPLFVSTQSEFEKFNDYLALQRGGRGNWIAVVSRITLALFAIALFLLIDGSPESLGLAVFMGFEALGLAAKNGWMPLSWLGPWWDIFAAAFCTNMGLIFRLYFYLHLARVIDKSSTRWLIGGISWALPMGLYAMQSANNPSSYYPELHAVVMLIVAVSGGLFCLRTYAFIRSQRLRWRNLALLSASAASVPSIFLALDSLNSSFINHSILTDILYAMHFNSGFLLALSAFFNISSLENRVKSLSLMQLKAKQLEIELELGRSVQTQHMRIPKLPAQIGFDYYQDAASYVSGDAFFLNWNEHKKIFTILVNDVTGHGVQAALKATICSVMADLIWTQGIDRREATDTRSKIAAYNQLICNYMVEHFGMINFHSISGAEFFEETGKLVLYRSNAPIPIVIGAPDARKTADEVIKPDVKAIPLANETLTVIDLKPGSIVILMSDGFAFSSREAAKIVRRLESFISEQQSQNIQVADVRRIISTLATRDDKREVDDRTVLVFKWQPVTDSKTVDVQNAI